MEYSTEDIGLFVAALYTLGTVFSTISVDLSPIDNSCSHQYHQMLLKISC